MCRASYPSTPGSSKCHPDRALTCVSENSGCGGPSSAAADPAMPIDSATHTATRIRGDRTRRSHRERDGARKSAGLTSLAIRDRPRALYRFGMRFACVCVLTIAVAACGDDPIGPGDDPAELQAAEIGRAHV